MITKPAVRMLALPVFVSSMVLSSQVQAIVVDGNLADLIGASLTNPYAPYNWAEAVDTNTDGDGVGFNITNTYAYYDLGLDTFYLGMSFEGAVGTSGGTEGLGLLQCGPGFFDTGSAGVFDGNSCESYGFSLNINADGSNEVNLRITGDNTAANGSGSSSGNGTGSGTGAESLTVFENAFGATVTWAVGDGGGDGVEFSISGLSSLLSPMSPLNPRDVQINFFAGSILHTGAEDQATLNLQAVPVPAAAWLFGAGIFGLLAAARRKK